MRRRGVVVGVVALVFVLLAVVLFDGPLTRASERRTSTAAPVPLQTPVPFPAGPGSELCAQSVLLEPRGEVAELVLAKSEAPTPPLEVVASGPGYRSPTVEVPPQPPGDNRPLRIAIDPPTRDLIGKVCIRNAGRKPVTFIGVGNEEFRSLTRLATTLDGQPFPGDLSLSFFSERPRSALSELGVIVERMTVARAFLGWEPLVWALLALVALGVPAAVLWTLSRVLDR